MDEPALGQAEAVPGRDVVVANPEAPCSLERSLRFRVRVFVELVAEGYAAETESKFRREDLCCAILHRTGLFPRRAPDEKTSECLLGQRYSGNVRIMFEFECCLRDLEPRRH